MEKDPIGQMMAKRVVLLTVDALGTGHVGWLGYNRDTTPNLDDLADEGLSFTNCIAQSSHTRESMPSMFFSAYPSEIGDVGPVPRDRETIATVLSNKGIQTAGFHSNPYLSRAYGFDRGFDEFYDSLSLGQNRLTAFLHRVLNHLSVQPYIRGRELNEKGLSWLTKADSESRQFLWLHYMDPHGPYQPSEEYQSQFAETHIGKRDAKDLWRRTVDSPETITKEEQQELVDLYDAEIRYTDEIIGQFIKTLRRQGTFEDTVVIIAADHGELFGEHGLYGHPRVVYDELVRVPLLMIGDGIPSKTITSPVENLDIASTIVETFDIDPVSDFDGLSLLSDEFRDRRIAVSEASGEEGDAGIRRVAVRTEDYHYCIEAVESDIREEEVWEIRGGALQKVERGTVGQNELRKLTRLVRNHLDGTPGLKGISADRVANTEVQDRLEDLGYK